MTTFGRFLGRRRASPPPRARPADDRCCGGCGADVNIANGNSHPTWAYTFTVGAGQTVIIGNYAVADATVAASEADSARLAALPSTALECMSTTDQAELGQLRVGAHRDRTAPERCGPPGATVNFSAVGHRRRHRPDPERAVAAVARRRSELDEHRRRDLTHAVRRDTGRRRRLPRRVPQRDRHHHQPAASLTLPPPTPPTPPEPTGPVPVSGSATPRAASTATGRRSKAPCPVWA